MRRPATTDLHNICLLIISSNPLSTSTHLITSRTAIGLLKSKNLFIIFTPCLLQTCICPGRDKGRETRDSASTFDLLTQTIGQLLDLDIFSARDTKLEDQ